MLTELGLFARNVLEVLLILFSVLVFLQRLWQHGEEEEEEGKEERRPWVEEAPAGADAQRSDFDRIVDFALRHVAHRLTCGGQQQAVPDLDYTCPLNCGLIWANCHLVAKKGTVNDFSTLHRDGPATTSMDENGELVLNAAAGLRSLRVRFPQYSLQVAFVTMSGVLEAEVSPVALRARVALQPPFRVELRALRVERLGPLRLRATGLGVCGPLLPHVERWLDRQVSAPLQALALRHLRSLVDSAFHSLSRGAKCLPPLRLFPGTKGAEEKKDKVTEEEKEIKKEKTEEIIGAHAKIPANAHLFFAALPLHFRAQVDHNLNVPFRIC